MKDFPDRMKLLNESSGDDVEFFILDLKNKSFWGDRILREEDKDSPTSVSPVTWPSELD